MQVNEARLPEPLPHVPAANLASARLLRKQVRHKYCRSIPPRVGEDGGDSTVSRPSRVLLTLDKARGERWRHRLGGIEEVMPVAIPLSPIWALWYFWV